MRLVFVWFTPDCRHGGRSGSCGSSGCSQGSLGSSLGHGGLLVRCGSCVWCVRALMVARFICVGAFGVILCVVGWPCRDGFLEVSDVVGHRLPSVGGRRGEYSSPRTNLKTLSEWLPQRMEPENRSRDSAAAVNVAFTQALEPLLLLSAGEFSPCVSLRLDHLVWV